MCNKKFFIYDHQFSIDFKKQLLQQMKLFNAAASLGALCAISEAVSIRSQQSTTNFDFEALNQRLENLKELNSNLVHRVPAHKQELVAQRL